MPLISRRRVLGERMMISEVVLEAGCVVPSHQHDNEQMAYVISGRLRFGLGQEGTDDHRTLEVGTGELLHLPSGLPHSAEALLTTRVIDLFSPPSETTGIDRD